MLMAELKKALFQSLLGKYALYVIQVISLMVLARLIAPADFGVVAAAQVFVILFQTMGVSGLSTAIVYRDLVPASLRDGCFTFSILLGIVIAIFCALLAPGVFNWFGFERGLFVFYTLAFAAFCAVSSMMPIASLQKDARFLSLARADIVAELLGLFACLFVLYVTSDGLIALTARFVLVPLARFIFYYWYSGQTVIGRPRLGREIKSVWELYDFAKFQILFNIVNYLSRNLDNILVAKYFGAAVLGVYEKTYQIMRYPLQLFTFAITPALQPVLTRYKEQPSEVHGAFIQVAARLAVVGVFSSTVFYHGAADVVFIMFGPDWSESVLPLQILALSIPVQMVMSSTGGVFQAFGRMQAMFFCGVFACVLSVTAIVYGIQQHSLAILCSSLVLAFHINYLQCVWTLSRAVFPSESYRGMLVVTLILGLNGINFLFTPSLELPETIAAAMIRLSTIGALAAFGAGILLLFCQKLKKII